MIKSVFRYIPILILGLLICAGCNNRNNNLQEELIGSWTGYKSIKGGEVKATYNFDSNNTGEYEVVTLDEMLDQKGPIIKGFFKWSVINDSTINIITQLSDKVNIEEVVVKNHANILIFNPNDAIKRFDFIRADILEH